VALYLDANIVIAMLVSEAKTVAVFDFLSRVDEPLLLSEYTVAEVASGLSRMVRKHELSLHLARDALSDFDSWRPVATETIAIDELDIIQAGELVRRLELKLRTPDALHLAICLRIDAKLVTHDGGLAEAALARGAVVVQP
jgi:predicted nucleic acid-binding protein